MTVEPGGGRELAVWVDESARAFVLEAFDALVAVSEEALARVRAEERDDAPFRVGDVQALRHQAGDAGPVLVAGPEELVVDVVRGTASHAAYELDVMMEALAGARGRLGEQAIEQIRGKVVAVTDAVEALIACESFRNGA